MDVPTRQSYVMAVVREDERMAAWAVAPAFAGLFVEHGTAATPFIVGAAMKIAYDRMLYAGFRRLRPPEG